MSNCCNCVKVEKTEWDGLDAVCFSAGGYEALIVPEVGANVIALKDCKRDLELLRTPDSVETFKGRPQVYGIPILFFPNRIEDGTFEADGRRYTLPINNVAQNHHIHGFFHKRKWFVTRMEVVGQDAVEVELSVIADNSTDFYQYLPHEFEFVILYRLSSRGLEQQITIKNNSGLSMPMILGFHTAFSVPFSKDSSSEDYRMTVTVGEKWELTKRIIPTGNKIGLDDFEGKLITEGVLPQGKAFEGHFTNKPVVKDGKAFSGAIIKDISKGVQLVYEVGESYKHWVIWNETGDKGFICPEPQTAIINSPNVKLPAEQTGFMMLEPGEVWTDNCRIYVE